MFATLFSLALILAFFQSVFAQGNLTINTFDLVQCQPTQITWTDSCSGPYMLLVVSADDMCGDAIVDLGNLTTTSTSWTVNLAAGTQVVLYVADAYEDDAWSATMTVGASNDTSCLAGGSSSATPSATLSTPSGTPSSTPSSVTPSDASSPSVAGSSPSVAGSSPSVTGSSPSVTGSSPSAAGTGTGLAAAPSASAFAPAGAANAGTNPSSGALSTRPLGAVTLGSAALAAALFAL